MKKKVFREKYSNNAVEKIVEDYFTKIAEEILKPVKIKTTKKKKSDK